MNKEEIDNSYLHRKYPLWKLYRSPVNSIPIALHIFEKMEEMTELLKEISKKLGE